ncbi:hypothetical protein AB0C42_29440 [Micromonospora taraxaci]|uniref:hypothetical protein n=1 Tax=Micromonospora TaxID=1873 RepID=UPI002416F049|nr:hypothetical protein [Micromonospora sp. WMMD967]MDG4838191.1 hypothetical protein [Micromonospora sp. WMMD967]
MTETAVLELNTALDHPAGDLEAEMRELEESMELQTIEAARTWLSAIGVCCF